MSARIRSLKSNIIKNRNIKNFAKTITSNFMNPSTKTPKENKKFGNTKSTRFSDYTITNTISSSPKTISNLKSVKKEKPIYLNIDNFHKYYLLNKNQYNYTLSDNYTQNEYNSIHNAMNSMNISNNSSKKKNLIKLEKSSYLSFLPFSSSIRSRNISNNNIYNRASKESLTNTELPLFLGRKSNNKILYFGKNINISRNINNFSFSKSNEFYQNNTYTKLILSPQKNDNLNKKSENEFNNKINNEIRKSNNDKYSISNNNDYKKEKNIKKLATKVGINNYYFGSNRISVNGILGYPSFNSYINSGIKRNENGQQFLYKTRLITLGKYKGSIKKDSYFKQIYLNENNLDKNMINIKTLELIRNLLFVYNKTLDEYLRYLYKKLRKIREENEILNINKMSIQNEIDKLKHKIVRILTTMKEGYSIKFFLMCVKNKTLFLNKFEEEDIEIIENDRQILNYYYTIYFNTKKNQIQNNSTNSDIFNKMKKIYIHSSDKDIISNDKFPKNNDEKIKKHKSAVNFTKKKFDKVGTVFNSVEEFFQNFEGVLSKLLLLMKESNDKNATNVYLKEKLQNANNNSKIKKKNYIPLVDEIKKYEKNLENLKDINKNLSIKLNYYRNDKFQNDAKILLVSKNIYKIYIELTKICDIPTLKKDDFANFGYKIYLKLIEEYFIKITEKVLIDKKRFPFEYEKLNQQIEKAKKKKAFILFQNLLAQKLEIKIDTVLKKASKIIYRKLRNTDNYMEHLINLKKIKKMEKEKNKIGVFFEFIDHNAD